jgi:predicted nuclease with TOPRIM domain
LREQEAALLKRFQELEQEKDAARQVEVESLKAENAELKVENGRLKERAILLSKQLTELRGILQAAAIEFGKYLHPKKSNQKPSDGASSSGTPEREAVAASTSTPNPISFPIYDVGIFHHLHV